MKKYAILLNPRHSRVYFEASLKLSVAELTLALSHAGHKDFEIIEESFGSVPYLCFRCQEPVNEKTLERLSRCSFTYALFEVCKTDGEPCFTPLSLPNPLYIDGGISCILKYSGKTNENFTRFMINLALFSSPFYGEKIKLLDPVAGKGTTLFEALSLGYDAYGIELSEKAAHDAFTYLKKYLEIERFKHRTGHETINIKESAAGAKRVFAELSRTKQEMKENAVKRWEMVWGNSQYADSYFKKNSFHIMVGDLPYGVQHGNVSSSRQGSFTRSPKELVSLCAPSWHKVLKPNGVIALSWNSFVFSRQQFAKLLEDAGFSVFCGEIYESLEHRVDNSIKRDLILAKKL